MSIISELTIHTIPKDINLTHQNGEEPDAKTSRASQAALQAQSSAPTTPPLTISNVEKLTQALTLDAGTQWFFSSFLFSKTGYNRTWVGKYTIAVRNHAQEEREAQLRQQELEKQQALEKEQELKKQQVPESQQEPEKKSEPVRLPPPVIHLNAEESAELVGLVEEEMQAEGDVELWLPSPLQKLLIDSGKIFNTKQTEKMTEKTIKMLFTPAHKQTLKDIEPLFPNMSPSLQKKLNNMVPLFPGLPEHRSVSTIVLTESEHEDLVAYAYVASGFNEIPGIRDGIKSLVRYLVQFNKSF